MKNLVLQIYHYVFTDSGKRSKMFGFLRFDQLSKDLIWDKKSYGSSPESKQLVL